MGDVFLHTLPHCFADHHGEDIGVRVLAGFVVFLVLDIIVRSLDADGHGHNHNHTHTSTNGNDNNATKNNTPRSQWRVISSSAVLLNLFGDALHNFTDGLAIGATFAASHIPLSSTLESTSPMSWLTSAFSLLKSRGGLASMSVFLHEIPHELGDFATLVNHGMSRNMAIMMQFMTAIAAFMGTAFGLYSSHIIEGLGHDVLLPFTAGGFIYLACTTILPEILETHVSVYMRILQIGSFGVGLAFMYAVAILEKIEGHEKDGHHHSHDHYSHHYHSHGEL